MTSSPAWRIQLMSRKVAKIAKPDSESFAAFRRVVINPIMLVVGLSLLSPLVFAQRTLHVIAHRGASAYAPENTLAAFRKAVELGADILELDIHQSKDSQLVVIHDGTVDRTTNGKGSVRDLGIAELRQFDAGSWFSPAFAAERIPTLEEVFAAVPDSTILLIELKGSSEKYPGIERRVVDLIHRRDAEHRLIMKSFDAKVLERLRGLDPAIPRLRIIVTEIPFLGLIVGHKLEFGTVLDDSVQYIQRHWFGLSKGFIQEAHERGYKVFVWDVNDRDRMEEMILKGIDGIETDHPDWVKEMLLQKERPN